MKILIITILSCCLLNADAQELYVFADPASNVPANSLSAKLSGQYVAAQPPYNRLMQRYTMELNYGINNKWMARMGFVAGNVHRRAFINDGVYFYTKYRFLSKDGLHKHFRMAGFAAAGISNNSFHFDETIIQGDKSGAEVGIIATQLWNKLALSATASHVQVLDRSRSSKVLYIPSRVYQAMNYSLSGGYLVLPFDYKDYKQTNLNVYVELIGQQALDRKTYFIDMAPALQLIFLSNTKLNMGYRFQLRGDMQRMSENSWMISIERTFLNAFRK